MLSAVALVCLGTFLAPLDDKQPAKNSNEGENEYNVNNYLSSLAFDKAATQKLNITLTNPKKGKQTVKWNLERNAFDIRDRNNAPETCDFSLKYCEMELRDKFFHKKPGTESRAALDPNTNLAQKNNNFFFTHTTAIPLTPGADKNEKRYFLLEAELQNLNFYDRGPGAKARGIAVVSVKRNVLLEATWDGTKWMVMDVHKNAVESVDPAQLEINFALRSAMSPPSVRIRKPAPGQVFDGEVKVQTDNGCTISIVLICGGVSYNPWAITPDPVLLNTYVAIFGFWPITGECTLCVTATRTSTGETVTVCVPIIQPAP